MKVLILAEKLVGVCILQVFSSWLTRGESWMRVWSRWRPEVPSQPFCDSVMIRDFTYHICCLSGSTRWSLLSWDWDSGFSHLHHTKIGWTERYKLPKLRGSKEWQIQMQFLERGIIVMIQSWHWTEKLASSSGGHSNSGFELSSLPWEIIPECFCVRPKPESM